MLLVKGICSTEVPHTVADSDLQIRGWPGHPDPEIRGAVSKKIFFGTLRASAWSKNKGKPKPPGHLP